MHPQIPPVRLLRGGRAAVLFRRLVHHSSRVPTRLHSIQHRLGSGAVLVDDHITVNLGRFLALLDLRLLYRRGEWREDTERR